MLGGNCRLRLSSVLKLNGKVVLKEGTGENINSFYKVASIKEPLIAQKAVLKAYKSPDTQLYDFNTAAVKIYVFKAK